MLEGLLVATHSIPAAVLLQSIPLPEESATKQRLLPWSLPNLMRKTAFFIVSYYR